MYDTKYVYVTNCNKVGASFFLIKEKLVVGVLHSNFRTVANGAVSSYEPKFILFIDEYTYIGIHLSLIHI